MWLCVVLGGPHAAFKLIPGVAGGAPAPHEPISRKLLPV